MLKHPKYVKYEDGAKTNRVCKSNQEECCIIFSGGSERGKENKITRRGRYAKQRRKILLDLLDETKRLIVAKEVMKERRLSNYKEPHSKDGAPFARRATDIVKEK